MCNFRRLMALMTGMGSGLMDMIEESLSSKPKEKQSKESKEYHLMKAEEKRKRKAEKGNKKMAKKYMVVATFEYSERDNLEILDYNLTKDQAKRARENFEELWINEEQENRLLDTKIVAHEEF